MLKDKKFDIIGMGRAGRWRQFQSMSGGEEMFERKLMLWSLKNVYQKRNYETLVKEFEGLDIDLSQQYTQNTEMTPYRWYNLNNQHCFQTIFTVKMMHKYLNSNILNVVDIGDSAGTHLKKISMLMDKGGGRKINGISVNLDPIAVDKINKNGGRAILCRAEDYEPDVRIDCYLSYEMMEHLHNPALFLHRLAKADKGDYMIVTVPYLSESRVGLRNSLAGKENITAENEHIFELNPLDWEKIALHAGWRVIEKEIYLQYPENIPFLSRWLRKIWKQEDFEGFLGLMLKRDTTVTDRYLSWEE